MRRGERQAWREIADAAQAVADSPVADEYMAKLRMREAWGHLYGIYGVSGLPRAAAEAET